MRRRGTRKRSRSGSKEKAVSSSSRQRVEDLFEGRARSEQSS